MSNNELDLQSHVLVNGHVIEASAGTGKTYSVAALVVRELAENEDLRIGNILITTFTRAAAGELRDRVRRRIAATAEQLIAGVAEEGDNVVAALLLNEAERANYVRRLRRAVVEFDTATISTIHAVCTKVLTMAGLPTMDAKEEDITAQLVAQVVNDSLVMIDFINRVRREGTPLQEAIMISGIRRFRPILLTTLTTFGGLMPLIFEDSLQAQYIIPMAISLAFGIVFATVITLLLVPCLYMILDDLDRWWAGKEARPAPRRVTKQRARAACS